MKRTKKRTAPKAARHEIVVSVQSQPITTAELAEPMRDGKQLAITKTWVSDKQIMRMVQRTPKQHIYERPARGGGKWSYVTGAYVEKVLNFVFGFLWDFDVVQHGREGDMVWVLGKLTVKDTSGNSITKTQFGRAEIKFKRDSKQMLDYGNDLKAATTDALKKCASLLGIASDIYGSTEYKHEAGKEVHEEAPVHADAAVTEAVPAAADLACFGVRKSGCGNDLTRQEYDYSKKLYGKPLCRGCQSEAKRK